MIKILGMRRIAFFVEGQTEQIFVTRLVKELFDPRYINIIQKQFRGGINIPKQEIIRSRSLSRKAQFEFLIFDCGSDNRVKSELLENMVNLHASGYEKIIGMRDLYPLDISDFDKLKKGLKFLPNSMKDYVSFFDIIVAIHEIEAWFLAETIHFRNIDKRLNGPFIKRRIGFNPYSINPEKRVHPAKDLDDIYQLVGKSYNKRFDQTYRIVNTKLNFKHIVNDLRYKIEPLGHLIGLLEQFRDKED